MDLHEFLTLERQQLQKDRKRLAAEKSSTCPAALILQTADFNVQCRRTKESNEPIAVSPSLATGGQHEELSSDLDLGTLEAVDGENEGKVVLGVSPSKSTKEFANQRQLLVGSARQYKSPNESLRRNLESGRPLSENRLPIHRPVSTLYIHTYVGAPQCASRCASLAHRIASPISQAINVRNSFFYASLS